jgi:hypothetical protein
MIGTACTDWEAQMNSNVVIALILAITAIIIAGMFIYYSEFQTCMREGDIGWCMRVKYN